MSEFITVQIGQCGNQIGSSFWPLALHEHGICVTGGAINSLKTRRCHTKNRDDLSDAFHSFFYVPDNLHGLSFRSLAELIEAKVKARAVLIDMEDSVVSRIKHGPLRKLFDQTCTVTNYPGSGNNWAIGYYTHGIEYQNRLEETIRRVAEKCDSLHGFLLMHSLGGGTGSGLGTATLKLLVDHYPGVDRFASSVYPMTSQDVITAPYNALLATRELLENATCVFPVENKALLDICLTQLNTRANVDQANYNALCKPFEDMNSIIVNMLLHLTSGSRFPGSLNIDMNDIATNLVAYPKLHYIFSSVAPIAMTAEKMCILQGSKLQDELFTNVWSRKNQLINVNPFQPGCLVLGAAHVVRGDTSLGDLKRNIERFQKKMKFTSWSKDAMKIGLCSVPPAGHTSSLLNLINSTAMSLLFKDIIRQFDILYKRKAHVHHYTQVDGFDESHFTNGKEVLLALCEQYAEIQNQKQINIPRLEVI